jgi:hypothetical protein
MLPLFQERYICNGNAAFYLRMDFAVFDERYHVDGLNAERYFATHELDEAIDVANQIGVRFVVVRIDGRTGDHWLVLDTRDNEELPLEP